MESVDDSSFRDGQGTEVSCDLVTLQGGGTSLPGPTRQHKLFRRLLDLGRGSGGGGAVLLREVDPSAQRVRSISLYGVRPRSGH